MCLNRIPVTQVKQFCSPATFYWHGKTYLIDTHLRCLLFQVALHLIQAKEL